MIILIQSPHFVPSFCSKLITDPDRTGIKETWRCNHIHGLKRFFTRKNGQLFQPKKKQQTNHPKTLGKWPCCFCFCSLGGKLFYLVENRLEISGHDFCCCWLFFFHLCTIDSARMFQSKTTSDQCVALWQLIGENLRS